MVSQNSVGRSSIARTPVGSGGGVPADAARSSFTQVEASGHGLNSHTKTARLLPRRSHIRSVKPSVGQRLTARAVMPSCARRVAIIRAQLGQPNRELTAISLSDRAGGDVVIGASVLEATRRSGGGDTSRRRIALSRSARSNRAKAQSESSSSERDTDTHGMIQSGLRGLRRKAAGREILSDPDVGTSRLGRRAVRHPTNHRPSQGETA